MKRALLLVLALASLPARALPIVAEPPHLVREARVTWRAEDERFGGYSGLEIAADGTSFLAVSDRGTWARGRLYVLERDFRWLGGFATRIRSFALGSDDLTDEVELFRSPFGALDNMEGIDVGTATDGSIRVTLLSDDNFFPLQRTEIVEFRLVE